MDRTCLPPGARLGEFEITRVLAVGGFGIVYLAQDHSLNREVAVKEFMPALLATRGHGQRVSVRVPAEAKTFAVGLNSFIDEAQLLARLSHPAIVKVYRFWKANGTGYMAMPYLRGPTLGDVRRSMREPPTEAWLRKLIEPLLDALAVLHAEAYYHRDISPDNVLVVENGLPVLLDFGAARRVLADRPQALTAIIKPHYAPIEQYAESRLLRQGPWTDIYALGALVAYLLDGMPPPASTARTLHDEMQPLALRRMPGISVDFLAAIDWALAVRPQDRPQSVAELRGALDRQRAPPPRRLADAGWRVGPQIKVPALAAEAGFARTLELARADDAGAAEDAAGCVEPAAEVAGPMLPRHRFKRRPWAWAAAAAVAGMVMLGLTRLPFDTLPMSPMAAPNVAPGPTRAEALRFDALIGGLQNAAPVEAPHKVATQQAAEEIIEGPPEKIIEAAPARPAFEAAPLAAGMQLASAQPRNAQAHENKALGAESSRAKVNRAAERRQGPRRKPAVVTARLPGPVEICAERNFFVRSWCVQRRCDEARFAKHPQCEQRQVANAMH